MTCAPLSDLPTEILASICQHLADRKSVFALSLVNARCNNAAAAVLFSRVQFKFNDWQSLKDNVKRFHHQFYTTNRLRLVQSVVIDGSGAAEAQASSSGPGFDGPSWDYSNLLIPGAARATENFLQVRNPDDEACKPLAELLADLPRLADVLYKHGRYLIPPCLLRCLQMHHTQCRLHLETFQLKSQSWVAIEPYEWELVTSPILYSINTTFLLPQKASAFTHDAVYKMAKGLAPNLREVITQAEDLSSWAVLGQGEELPGYSLPSSMQNPSGGSLEYLDMSLGEHSHRLNPQITEVVSQSVTLQTLKLRGRLSPELFAFLASDCEFSSLQALSLQIRSYHVDVLENPSPDAHLCSMKRFIQGLPELTSLELVCADSFAAAGMYDAISCVLPHHGPTLWKLSLEGITMTSPQVELIPQMCPLMQELGITIRRSGGDAAEVSAYAAIGALPMLQRLSLVLDRGGHWTYSETPATDSIRPDKKWIFSEDGTQANRIAINSKCVRDVLINYAVDENLARSILSVIRSGSHGRSRLEAVDIQCTGTVTPHIDSLQRVVGQMKRHWVVERISQGGVDQHLAMTVTEHEQKHREILEQINSHSGAVVPVEMEDIIRQLWPQPAFESGTTYKWHSMPLRL